LKAAARGHYRRAVAAAASLTGKRFSLLVASSLVATTGIVAASLTAAPGNSPVAELLGRDLAASAAPSAPAPEPSPSPSPASPAPAPAPSPPLASPAPLESAPAPPPAAPEKIPTEPAEPAVEPGPVQHVFLVSLASPGFDAAFGATARMPYLASTLRPQGLLLDDYSLLDEAALPNGIATISGQPPNAQTRVDCPTYTDFPAGSKSSSRGVVAGDGCVYPVETLTLADQLVGAQLRWHAYMEGMADESAQPDNCVHPEPDTAEAPAPGGYSVRLNPFPFFHSLLDLGDCSENDVPLSELEADLKRIESTPNFSYISPNLCNVGIGGQCPAGAADGAAAADAFLSAWVPKILASPAYKRDGLLIVSFGQVDPGALADPAVAATVGTPPRVGALLLSRFVSPGGSDGAAYDPYSLLRTLEDLFRLEPLGGAAGPRVRSLAPTLEGTSTGD